MVGVLITVTPLDIEIYDDVGNKEYSKDDTTDDEVMTIR